MTRTVVVQGSNLTGSRPGGWWRHRAEAATRLIGPVAQSLGGALTIFFDGSTPPRVAALHKWLDMVHTGHVRRDGADAGATPHPIGLPIRFHWIPCPKSQFIQTRNNLPR